MSNLDSEEAQAMHEIIEVLRDAGISPDQWPTYLVWAKQADILDDPNTPDCIHAIAELLKKNEQHHPGITMDGQPDRKG